MTAHACVRRALAAVVMAASAVVLSAQDVAPPFRASADMVKVDVSVQQHGRSITGLTAADFTVTDNGVAQRISTLQYGRLPIDVTIALDVSESVTGSTLDQLRRAVRELMADAGPQDRLRLLTFNARVSRVADFGASASALDAAFSGIRPSGGTALYDATAIALAQPPALDRRQLAVIFTDGFDEGSTTTAEELVDVARHTSPTLAIVLAGGPTTPAIYDRLTMETGGFSRRVALGESLSTVFRRALADFRASYVLYFTPTDLSAPGFHQLAVTVKRSDAIVRARRGYAR